MSLSCTSCAIYADCLGSLTSTLTMLVVHYKSLTIKVSAISRGKGMLKRNSKPCLENYTIGQHKQYNQKHRQKHKEWRKSKKHKC